MFKAPPIQRHNGQAAATVSYPEAAARIWQRVGSILLCLRDDDYIRPHFLDDRRFAGKIAGTVPCDESDLSFD